MGSDRKPIALPTVPLGLLPKRPNLHSSVIFNSNSTSEKLRCAKKYHTLRNHVAKFG